MEGMVTWGGQEETLQVDGSSDALYISSRIAFLREQASTASQQKF